MARIIINKGFISIGGRFYKAGEVVTIADANQAKRIVARSGGDFDFYHGQETVAREEAGAPAKDAIPNSDTGGDGENDTVPEPDNGSGEDGLPAIDANAAVLTGKGKKK